MAERTILLVEDDEIMRLSLEDRLRLEGFTVASAASIAEAKTLLGQQSFALVLTDIRLPDGSGAALFDFVRERYPGLPVILMTAFGSIADAVRLVKAGAVDYLEKPFEVADLIDTVRRVLEAAERVRGGAQSLKEMVEDAEKTAIVDALAQHQGSIIHTAEALGISRKNLWEKMRRYSISR